MVQILNTPPHSSPVIKKILSGAIALFLVLNSAFADSLITNFKLQRGDLLFQDLNCGQFCDSVDSVTYGYKNSYVSHVGLVIDASESNPQVIEAISQGVVITPLAQFLQRSLDDAQQPRVMVGRLKATEQKLIPNAIVSAEKQLGKPYNESFVAADGQAFYCSELIDYSFQVANHNQAVFQHLPMDFTNGKSPKILALWQNYYQNLQQEVPQGQLGTNPGAMSRESNIQIIYFYGQLREH